MEDIDDQVTQATDEEGFHGIFTSDVEVCRSFFVDVATLRSFMG